MREQNKRFVPWILATVALAVVAFVAIAAGGDDQAAPSSTSTTVSEATTTTAGPLPPEGPLGAVLVGPGEDIQIRSLQAISGDGAPMGLPGDRAVEVAVADYGPIMDHGVTSKPAHDDSCSEAGGRLAAAAIAAEPEVVGIVGPSCAAAEAGASPAISDTGLVMMSTAVSSGSAVPGRFRTTVGDVAEATAVATFLRHVGFARAAVIHDDSGYTAARAQAFAEAFRELGGEPVPVAVVPRGGPDMVSALTELAADAPEAIYAPLDMPEGGHVAQQLDGVDGLQGVLMVGGSGLLVDSMLALRESEGWYFAAPDLQLTNTSITGTTAEGFLAAYRDRFGEAPSSAFWAHSYDATIMLLTAIQEVAVEIEDGSLFIDRAQLREALQAMTGLAGITGTLGCDDEGECGSQRIQITLHADHRDVTAAKHNIAFQYPSG